MRGRYTYLIQTRARDDRWHRGITREDSFLRDPVAIARSLLERWVIDHPGQATGGVRLIVSDSDVEPDHVHVTVRVRVYQGGLRDHAGSPAASAYLGYELEDRVSAGTRRHRWARRRPAEVAVPYDDAA